MTENNSQMSTLMIANIEALASGETAKCTDSCKEWSGNSGGGIACDCGRYTGKCKTDANIFSFIIINQEPVSK